jgi:hypothetical protein
MSGFRSRITTDNDFRTPQKETGFLEYGPGNEGDGLQPFLVFCGPPATRGQGQAKQDAGNR